jgi:hypothetical protein
MKSSKVGDQTVPELDIKNKLNVNQKENVMESQNDFDSREIEFLKNIHQDLAKEIFIQKERVGVSSLETHEVQTRNRLTFIN